VARSKLAYDNCPAARALDVVGERWALPVVREALDGATRFDDFRKALPISEQTLARRLSELTADGVFERRAYQHRPARYEYVLTERGRALSAVLSALAGWGEKWVPPDPSKPDPRPRPGWTTV
jgi:DNA-binding HxlR family transcriptional regulator